MGIPEWDDFLLFRDRGRSFPGKLGLHFCLEGIKRSVTALQEHSELHVSYKRKISRMFSERIVNV